MFAETVSTLIMRIERIIADYFMMGWDGRKVGDHRNLTDE